MSYDEEQPIDNHPDDERERERGTCGQDGCSDSAVARGFWPGRPPSLLCSTHLMKAKNISAALGFYLHTELL